MWHFARITYHGYSSCFFGAPPMKASKSKFFVMTLLLGVAYWSWKNETSSDPARSATWATFQRFTSSTWKSPQTQTNLWNVCFAWAQILSIYCWSTKGYQHAIEICHRERLHRKTKPLRHKYATYVAIFMFHHLVATSSYMRICFTSLDIWTFPCSKYADEYLAHIVASSSLILWVYIPKPLWRKTGKIWNKMQTKYIIYKLYKNIWRTAGLRNALTKEHVDKNTIKEPCLLTRESESLAPATCCLKFVPLPHLRSMRHPCFVNKKRPVRTTVSFEEPALFNDQNKYVEVYQDTGSKRNVTQKNLRARLSQLSWESIL